MKHAAGLTSQKATNLLVQYGRNEIIGKGGRTLWQTLLDQFTSALVILLVIASIASVVLGDVVDGVFIMAIVVLNGVLGFIQEYKAEKAIAALKVITVSTVRVIRDGVEQKIDSKFLVPGDIIFLEEGDKVPADCVLLESLHVEVNESSLTGESMSVEKNYADKEKNQVLLGTIIVKGRARAKVVATGMKTRFGSIARSLSEIKEEPTPLQKKLDVLGRQLGFLALGASSLVFVIGWFSKIEFIELMLTSISLAVAAVPEGLPAVITITLAVGMQRMARKKAILRKLSSIEALGSTSVIATDKTGTLTKNEMRVAKYWVEHNEKKSLERLITAGVLCNNASIVFTNSTRRYDVLGDTTEGALLLFAQDHELTVEQVKNNGVLLEEYAFDPTIKMMTVVWKHDKNTSIYTKGAPENVLGRSAFVLHDGKEVVLTDEIRKTIEHNFQSFAKEGLRVIALGYRNVRVMPKQRQKAEENLVFLGFVGIADPPRSEIKDAIILAARAGIRTIMITGDNELTANAIGKHIGLIHPGEEIVTGKQFASMTDEEVLRRLPNIRIFARATPDQKLRIVQLLQKMGNIVAVTGDGVNDALALKQSDVGVAMGITGTDVAKEASDMILVDDNYATLVTAVEEGRTIFDNIKSAIQYLVGCNIGEVLAVVVGMLLGWPLILTPLQLLYINLVTDGLPAIALAVSPKHDAIMQRKPRTGKAMFYTIDIFWFLEVSTLTAATTLFAFWIGQLFNSVETARAFAFTTIILVQHFILLDVWNRDRSIFRSKIFSSIPFLIAFFSPLIMQVCILFIPIVTNVFGVAHISVIQLIWIVGISAILLLVSETRKVLLHIHRSHHHS
jgi:P-type Ca2+ transporter type 2C